MEPSYKYDVAFSCAEEDLSVAISIADALRANEISYYLYTEHTAIHWGENIFKISLDKYGVESRFVLMLISEYYVNKHWSDIERQIAQTAARIGEPYILPLLLGDEVILPDGISKNIMYIKWKNNPNDISQLINNKLNGIEVKSITLDRKAGDKRNRTIVKSSGADATIITDSKINILNLNRQRK